MSHTACRVMAENENQNRKSKRIFEWCTSEQRGKERRPLLSEKSCGRKQESLFKGN